VSRMLRLLRGNTGDLHHRRCRERDCANGDTSELVVLLTPITFEGYCSELKKAVDRVIPLILHTSCSCGTRCTTFGGARYPRLLGVGLLVNPSAKQERIFGSLIERSAINMHAPRAKSGILDAGDPSLEEKIAAALAERIA